MPLTKQYLTYKAECRYGVIAGRKGGALLKRGGGGRLIGLSPALEGVVLWDLRTSTRVGELSSGGVEVGVVCLSGDGRVLAAGLEDGSIVLWDMDKRAIAVTFNGHRSAVTSLHFNADHTQLVSGSKDTHVIVWDTVSEAGLFRLKGHKNPVTECRFLSAHNILITSSKDGLVKLWDLDTQHCFQTLVSHHREVWSIETVGGVSGGDVRLLAASGGSELKVYKLSREESDQSKVPMVAMEVGVINHSSNGRVTLVRTDPSRRYLATMCQHSGVDVYSLRTASELEQLLKKRKKRAAKKSTADTETISLSVKDEFRLVCSVRGSGRHRSVDLCSRTRQELLVLLTMQNNALELHQVVDEASQQLYAVTSPGHRSDIRTLCFSSDSSRILSGSAKLVKVWNRSTRQCVCTVTSRYALCSTFVPGDRYAIIGTKCGHLQLLELSSNAILEDIPAHEGAVWAVSLFPDKRGVASASADHTVTFWEFELVSSDDATWKGKRLTLSPTRTLKLSEDVLALCHSANGRLLAVALLDSTIKVFFNDTLKFFLSLYGHKLPVLAMDISSDSSLLASCSADKNIRIWGLDFGDCHKAIFAHADSILCVRFVPDTHLLFSASKDSTIKCWDADNFQHVQTLKGHHGEVWCLALSSDGDTVVSGSHDLSIRLWQRTLEPLILSEQRELEREAFMDQLSAPETAEHVIPGEVPSDVTLPLTKSKETISVVDRLLEALAIWQEETAKHTEHLKLCTATGKEVAPPKPHPMLIAKGDIQAERFVLEVVRGIKSSELEECLLVMPFDQMVQFLRLGDYWLERGWETELTCRCLFFLLRVHHPQLINSHHLLPTLTSLSKHSSTQITHLKDLCGINLAGLHYLRRELENKGTRVFQDAPTIVRKKRKLTS